MSKIKKNVFIIIVILIFVCTCPCHVIGATLFTYNANANFANDMEKSGLYSIKLTEDLLIMNLNSQIDLNLPGADPYVLIHDKIITHKNGDVTWLGFIKEWGKGYRTSLTIGQDTIEGRIITPDGLYTMTNHGEYIFLESVKEKGLISGLTGPDDYLVPEKLPDQKRRSNIRIAASAQGTENVTIDLMVIYNQEMADKYPGTALETKVNQLVAIANQAYEDSKVYITLRLVHMAQINYSNTTDNATALDALTYGYDEFSSVSSLRIQYGADLVTFIRPYNSLYHSGCGIAWLNGLGGADISLYSDFGYNVISEGQDLPYYCDDTTLAHELGHNMGNEHDRDHASTQGAYPYSYGHDRSGINAFATIMSYDSPTVNYFSNPDVSGCNGYPCGVAEEEPDSANNALSMNNTRSSLAAFMATTVLEPAGETTYVIPVFKPAPDYYSGLAVRNINISNQANLNITVYDINGNTLKTESKTIPAAGQIAYVIGTDLSSQGWIKIISDQQLGGLNWIVKNGTSHDYYMASVPFTNIMSQSLVIPHVDQSETWDATAFLANTNSSSATATLTYISPSGVESSPVSTSIPANGSKEVPISSIIGDSTNQGGSLYISSTQTLAAFMLYDNLKIGNYSFAGINAVDVTTVTNETNYYIPVFKPAPDYYSGLAIRNLSTTSTASITIRIYDRYGYLLKTEAKSIAAKGQTAYVLGADLSDQGWIKITTDQGLAGLNWMVKNGVSPVYYMASVPFAGSVSKSLMIPHVDQGSTWDATAFMANPNSTSASVTLTYVSPSGVNATPYSTTISANGSAEISVSTILNNSTVTGGSILIESTQGLTAFVLYDNLKTGNHSFAGINAVDISD